ncbi:MAG: hypothetical protein WCL06_00095 [Bacteroidota bacterium]
MKFISDSIEDNPEVTIINIYGDPKVLTLKAAIELILRAYTGVYLTDKERIKSLEVDLEIARKNESDAVKDVELLHEVFQRNIINSDMDAAVKYWGKSVIKSAAEFIEGMFEEKSGSEEQKEYDEKKRYFEGRWIGTSKEACEKMGQDLINIAEGLKKEPIIPPYEYATIGDDKKTTDPEEELFGKEIFHHCDCGFITKVQPIILPADYECSSCGIKFKITREIVSKMQEIKDKKNIPIGDLAYPRGTSFVSKDNMGLICGCGCSMVITPAEFPFRFSCHKCNSDLILSEDQFKAYKGMTMKLEILK